MEAATEMRRRSLRRLALLLGLGMNALLGWWWADPVAALAMVYFVVREGWEAVSKRELCCAGELEASEKCVCPTCQAQAASG